MAKFKTGDKVNHTLAFNLKPFVVERNEPDGMVLCTLLANFDSGGFEQFHFHEDNLTSDIEARETSVKKIAQPSSKTGGLSGTAGDIDGYAVKVESDKKP
jgi:uncharacterized protein YodC (DUF2158 family)